MKKITIFIGVLMLCITAQFVYAETYKPDEIQQAMSSLLYEIEKAAGHDHKASNAIKALDEEGKQILYDSVKNKEKFMDSTFQAYERIDAAKKPTETVETLQEPDTSSSLMLMLTPSPTTPAYPPNYPPTYSVAYNIAKTLGLTSSNEERCDGVGLEIYEDALYAAEKLADIGDAACSVAGCDISGVGCAFVCGFVEGYKLVVLTARIPSDACNKHSEGVNSAEIEAGYENTAGTLTDLATSLGNQDKILENQKELRANQIRLLRGQGRMMRNQAEIISLLKTPQGRRPGWNKTIYSKKKKKKK
jgi:hypothetical protein